MTRCNSCEAFVVSRTPRREIFRDLASEGDLSLRSHRSVRVSELSHITLRSFFQAAPMVYSATLRKADVSALALRSLLWIIGRSRARKSKCS